MSDVAAPDDAFPADRTPEPAARPPREPLLDQAEIDAAVGYRPGAPEPGPNGTRAVLGAGASPREKLPMLAVVCDDLARRLSGSLRSLFAGDVDVAVAGLSTARYGDVIDDLVLPSQVVTFKADGWDGSGLVAMGPDFALLVLESLLGGGRGPGRAGVPARPFSPIEGALLTRFADAVLALAQDAFAAVSPVAFTRARVEADPRLAGIGRPGENVHVASFSLALSGRSARFAIVVPDAALETVRNAFRGHFPGVKLGRDDVWSNHFATEIWQAPISVEAVLHETTVPLRRVLGLAVGDTLMFDMRPTDLIEVRCGALPVTRGRIGRVEGRMAVQVVEPVTRPRPGRDGGR